MTNYKPEPSLEDGIPISTAVSKDEEELEPSLDGFDQDFPMPTSDENRGEKLRRRLSSLSKMYDVDGDGVLDEYEQALRDMDKTGRGFISNAQAVSLLKEQLNLQKNLLNFKRVILVLSVFTVVLALSNLGTAWAAATLAKDTTVQGGVLVTRNDAHDVVMTGDNVLTVQGKTVLNDDASSPSGRRLQPISQTFTATVSTMPATLAQTLFSHCPDPAYVDRVFPNGGIHNLQVCPSSATGTTHRTLGGAPTTVYTYDMPDSKQLVVSCPSNDVDCTMSGDALLLSAYNECIDPSDCQSGSCTQKLDASFSCDICNPTNNAGCASPRQCFSMNDLEEAQSIADAPPYCYIDFGGDCSQDESGCVTGECHGGICRCNTLSSYGCADGETCQDSDGLGFPTCV